MADAPERPNDRRDDPSDVRIARISAWQAVIVAAISAAAGIGATLLGTRSMGGDSGTAAPPPPPELAWLTITAVDLDAGASGVRVVAEVNGRGLSYPTRVLWAEPRPEMSAEAFALVPSDEYAVRFEVIADVGGRVTRFASQAIQVTRADQLPRTGTYEVHEVSDRMSRRGPVSGRVEYRLSDRAE